MVEFFRGWRRKVGVVTLLMACVLAIFWFRSPTKTDVIRFSIGEQQHRLSSSNDYGIAWETWNWIGNKQSVLLVRQAPHGILVIPLILISTYLLFSNPYKSNQDKSTEPIAVDGA